MMIRVLAAAVVAAALLLLIWALFRTLKRPMPRLAWPLVIAGSLVGYAVYDEYSWAGRTRDALPAQVTVIGEGGGRSPFSPWSYLIPRTERLSVIDRAAVRTHPFQPDLRLVEVILLERALPTRQVSEVIDCAGARYAVLSADQRFEPDGVPLDVGWQALPGDDARLRVACNRA